MDLSRDMVKAEMDLIHYLVEGKVNISFQEVRKKADANRPTELTNGHCVRTLYPKSKMEDAARKVIMSLAVENFLEKIPDRSFPFKPDFWVFGLEIKGREVYVKLRREQPSPTSTESIFVMSLHFSDRPFDEKKFPFKNVTR